ncbi:metallophosphoesterase [Cognatishimia sp. F0-27]|uniref:metallophosphoesterase family protein n=1 Tax=Cognatishimia sp. F0-27 TaxID=2816855 RepID=UPI001D0CA7C0|nr:metallophosphoesterase [Cognatishimia sp. F0-27]MCC1494521.1 metallophosphoesterase [Cognatishimia sp. F0-27]
MAARALLFCGAMLCALWIGVATAGMAAPLRVAVISDFNGSYGSTDYRRSVRVAIDRIIAIRPDLVLATGDMVAGQRRPALSDSQIRAMWRGFHANVTDPLTTAGIPLAVTPGNHDASAYRSFARERQIYEEEWLRRKPDLRFAEGSRYPFHYAFDLGPARFVSMDVTTVGALPKEQMQWLRGATQGGAARIVFSHLPLWPFAIGRETEVIGDRALETLFRDMGVDLHLSGHHHAFYPGVVDGLAVVSQACLGSGPRRLIGTTQTSERAITLLDIAEDGAIRVSALRGAGFDTSVDISGLPKAVQSPMRVIERLDIAPTAGVRWQRALDAGR